MNIFLRIAHPLFSWAVLFFWGMEAIHRELYLSIVIVAIGLAGLSQTFWRSKLRHHRPYSTGDLIAFALGVAAAIVFPLIVAWEFLK